MFMPYFSNGRLVCWYILDTYEVYAYTLPGTMCCCSFLLIDQFAVDQRDIVLPFMRIIWYSVQNGYGPRSTL